MSEIIMEQQPTEEQIERALEQGDVDPRLFTQNPREMTPGNATASHESLERYYAEVRLAEALRIRAEFNSQFLFVP